MIIRVRSTPCVYEESESDIIDRPREAQRNPLTNPQGSVVVKVTLVVVDG